jgi:hypothetical protein
MERRTVVSYRRFGTIYQSNLKGQAVKEDLECLISEDETIGSPSSVYQYTLSSIPEKGRSN